MKISYCPCCGKNVLAESPSVCLYCGIEFSVTILFDADDGNIKKNLLASIKPALLKLFNDAEQAYIVDVLRRLTEGGDEFKLSPTDRYALKSVFKSIQKVFNA